MTNPPHTVGSVAAEVLIGLREIREHHLGRRATPARPLPNSGSATSTSLRNWHDAPSLAMYPPSMLIANLPMAVDAEDLLGHLATLENELAGQTGELFYQVHLTCDALQRSVGRQGALSVRCTRSLAGSHRRLVGDYNPRPPKHRPHH